jgi:DNA-binding SARP family transcriptional activator
MFGDRPFGRSLVAGAIARRSRPHRPHVANALGGVWLMCGGSMEPVDMSITSLDPAPSYGLLGPIVAAPLAAHLPFARKREWTLLSVLLMSPSRPVALSSMIDALWETAPPRTYREQVLNRTGWLRRTLARADAGASLRAERDTVTFDVDPSRVDHVRFVELHRAGQAFLVGGDYHGALSAFGRALTLWRGSVLAGAVPSVLAAEAARLVELRMHAWDGYVDACMHTGHIAEAVVELTVAVRTHPLRERSVELLMRALHGSGRTAQALAEFRGLRQRLREELGIEPGAAVQRTHQRILQTSTAATAEDSYKADLADIRRAIEELKAVTVSLSSALTPFLGNRTP